MLSAARIQRQAKLIEQSYQQQLTQKQQALLRNMDKKQLENIEKVQQQIQRIKSKQFMSDKLAELRENQFKDKRASLPLTGRNRINIEVLEPYTPRPSSLKRQSSTKKQRYNAVELGMLDQRQPPIGVRFPQLKSPPGQNKRLCQLVSSSESKRDSVPQNRTPAATPASKIQLIRDHSPSDSRQ